MGKVLKEQAENRMDFRRKHLLLDEWFEEWFQIYKLPVVKETSVYSMKKRLGVCHHHGQPGTLLSCGKKSKK